MSEFKLPETTTSPTAKSIAESEVGGSANLKLKESAARNLQFNNRLEVERSGRTLASFNIPSEKNSILDQMRRIKQVLRDKGMDSQQAEQALPLIMEILES